MAKQSKKKIEVQGSEITLLIGNDGDYISLTDMARGFEGEPGEYIRNWIRNGSTVQYMGVWEKVHNPDFNLVEFHQIKSELVDNRFLMSAKKWIARTSAIGIQSKAGRYGGTYAHEDIALQFATWLSPEFHVYLVKEFKRLKRIEVEQQKEVLSWNLRRTLAKVNYHIHTDAVKQNLIPERINNNPKKQGIIFASEADVLNVALFGMTAKEWRMYNTDKQGNIRDYATGQQLLVLANLESHNAQFLNEGLSADERLIKLNEIAIYQMEVLLKQEPHQGLEDYLDGYLE